MYSLHSILLLHYFLCFHLLLVVSFLFFLVCILLCFYLHNFLLHLDMLLYMFLYFLHLILRHNSILLYIQIHLLHSILLLHYFLSFHLLLVVNSLSFLVCILLCFYLLTVSGKFSVFSNLYPTIFLSVYVFISSPYVACIISVFVLSITPL